MLVRLCQGEVHGKVGLRLSHLLTQLWRDPDLDVGAAVSTMLHTGGDILRRFDMYKEYPFRLWELVIIFNPRQYPVAMTRFMRESESKLDKGLSLPLRRLVQSLGTEEVQDRFMQSKAFQDALVEFTWSATFTSLPVERKHVESKRNEGVRLCHTAVASRNLITRAFLRETDYLAAETRAAAARVRAAQKLRVTSLAWARCDRRLLPQPLGGRAATGRKAYRGDAAAVQRYAQEHKAALQAEVDAERALARAKLESLNARSTPRTTCQVTGHQIW